MSSATAPARARTRIRCSWPSSPISIAYHDREWGVPLKDDRKLFEFLVLDAAQAGLSWEIILRKREGFRAAFDDFNPEKVARYDDKKVLMKGIPIVGAVLQHQGGGLDLADGMARGQPLIEVIRPRRVPAQLGPPVAGYR